MSVLRGQVFWRDFVEVVAALVGGMCATQASSAPEVYGGEHDSVPGGHIFRRQEPLGEQARLAARRSSAFFSRLQVGTQPPQDTSRMHLDATPLE